MHKALGAGLGSEHAQLPQPCHDVGTGPLQALGLPVHPPHYPPLQHPCTYDEPNQAHQAVVSMVHEHLKIPAMQLLSCACFTSIPQHFLLVMHANQLRSLPSI